MICEQVILEQAFLEGNRAGCLRDPSSLHALAVAFFELHLLSVQADLVSPATCVPQAVNTCMKMLQSACKKAAGGLCEF